MRLLDRYLLRELLVPFGYCLGGFFIFWISSDLLMELDSLQKRKLGLLDVVEYYAVRSPELLALILPIAFLLALLYALTNHGRHHELTAIRAAGVSLWRLSFPYLATGLMLSGGVFSLNEWWVPEAASAAEAVKNRYVTDGRSESGRRWETKVGFINTRENRKWFIAAFNLSNHEMTNVHIEWILPDGTRRVINADQAAWVSGNWVFTNVHETVYPPTPGAYPDPPVQTSVKVMTELTETPEQIESEIKAGKIGSLREARNAQFSVREILNYKRLHSDTSDKVTMMDTMLHARLAAPWTCIVVVLIALPFGAQAGRRNVFVGVASSIVICFSYFVLQQLAMAMGTRGSVPPAVAAWLPNALFGLAGVGMTWRIR
jgi:lipopolysaccharide export system permease protein